MMPGTGTHAYAVERPESGSDAEGNPKVTRVALATGRGHLEPLSTKARLSAAQAGQQVDASLLLNGPTVMRPGDRVVCRGFNWLVQSVDTLRSPVRVLLQQVP